MIIARNKIRAGLSALFIIFGLHNVQSCFASGLENIKDAREMNRYIVAFQKLICDTEDNKLDLLFEKSDFPLEARDQFQAAYKLNGNIASIIVDDEAKERVIHLSRAHEDFWPEVLLRGYALMLKSEELTEDKVANSAAQVPFWDKQEEVEFAKKILANPVLKKHGIPTSIIFVKD